MSVVTSESAVLVTVASNRPVVSTANLLLPGTVLRSSSSELNNYSNGYQFRLSSASSSN